MKIDQHNYQEWALDYIEGTLNAEQRASFDVFLSQHAPIADDIRSLQSDMPLLPVESIVYPDKQHLLRGGRVLLLGRISSFLGGAVAASLLLGLFLFVNDHASNKEKQLAEQAKAVFNEDLADPVQPETWSETAIAEPQSAAVKQPLTAAVQPVVSVRQPKLRVAPLLPAIAPKRITARETTPNDQPLDKVITITATPSVAAMPRRIESLLPVELNTASVVLLSSVTPAAENPNETETTPKRFNYALASILAPFDQIIPIKTYRTENERGVEIASIIRIGNKKTE